jgi:glucan 1,3-beta-glucosidase
MPGRRTLAAAVLACAALATIWTWWRDARPVALEDGAAARLPCLSYAPSSQGSDARSTLTVARVREDLALLGQRTRCVRTYTVSEGFDQVPAVAGELGLEVLLGLWIGRDKSHNEREIARGIRVAREHRATIRAIVVGNEVLLRHELTADELSLLIRRVAKATGLPVTYADVWGLWIQHRSLAGAVSFVTVHILPYWDDRTVGIDAAVPYVEALYTGLERRFSGRTLYIGETGWPSAGRPRGPSVPSRVNQARYLREFSVLAGRRGFDFNVIEAFDQPWKIANEGTVGGHWGIYDALRREKFAWTGPVVEAPQGRAIVSLALLAGAVGAFTGAFLGRLQRGRVALGVGAAAALGVAAGARQWQDLADGNATWIDWAATLAVCAGGWLALLTALPAIASRRTAGDAIPRALELALLLCCAYVSLGLVFAGRHRDFPVWIFLPAVLAFTLVALADPGGRAAALRARSPNEEVLLASWLVVAGLLVPLLERLQNARAVGWGLSSALLGLAVLAPLALQSRQRHRTTQHAYAGPGEVVQHHAAGAKRDA